MNTEKISKLSSSVKSLSTGKFYIVNGHGIISFKSDINYAICRNAISYINGDISSKISHNLVEELNEAIKPILNKYAELAKEEIKKEIEND